MLAKLWKNLLLTICVIAILFNITSKLVRRYSLDEQLNSVVDGASISDVFKKEESEKNAEKTPNKSKKEESTKKESLEDEIVDEEIVEEDEYYEEDFEQEEVVEEEEYSDYEEDYEEEYIDEEELSEEDF